MLEIGHLKCSFSPLPCLTSYIITLIVTKNNLQL
nr:MAG TPA: hypothetical protein [Bacteriophage sp.]